MIRRNVTDSLWLLEITKGMETVLCVTSEKTLSFKARAGMGLSSPFNLQPSCLARTFSIKLSSALKSMRACKARAVLCI